MDMNTTFTISKMSLINLLSAFLPNPDDPYEPKGPGSPVISDSRKTRLLTDSTATRQFARANIGASEPEPNPWRSHAFARSMIEKFIEQYHFAEIVAGSESSGRTMQIMNKQLQEFIDDYCGTPPHPWPWPWKRFDADHIRPIDLLIIGAQFQDAANGVKKSTLADGFSKAADKFIESGLKQM